MITGLRANKVEELNMRDVAYQAGHDDNFWSLLRVVASKNTILKKIHCHHSSLSKDAFEFMLFLLTSKDHNVTSFELQWCSGKGENETFFFFSFFESLCEASKLERLVLSGSRMSDECVEKVVPRFFFMPSLKHLCLAASLSQKKMVFPPLKSGGSCLTHLDVSENDMDGEVISSMLKCVKESLLEFRASNCNNNNNSFIRSVCDGISGSHKLTFLDLSYNNAISVEEIELLFRTFPTTLKTLNLSYCRLFSPGMMCVARCMLRQTSIESLFLVHTQLIGSQEAEEWSKTLCFNYVLRHLDLSVNAIASGALSFIQRGFDENGSLLKLSMQATSGRIELALARNRTMQNACREKIVMLLALRKRTHALTLWHTFPKEITKMICATLWQLRCDVKSWWK